MQYPSIAKEVLQLKKTDLKVRSRLVATGELFNGYHPKMEEVHIANAGKLEKIISEIGYPNIEKVGAEASQAAWLIIQHAISLPIFMKKCLQLAEKEAELQNIDPVNVVFLKDRIAMYEDKPQMYGTQFIENEHGELAPYRLAGDLQEIDERRKKLGLNSVDERLAELRKILVQEKASGQSKIQIQEEKIAYNKWRKKVGWIK